MHLYDQSRLSKRLVLLRPLLAPSLAKVNAVCKGDIQLRTRLFHGPPQQSSQTYTVKDFLKLQESYRYQESDADVKVLEAKRDDIADGVEALVDKASARDRITPETCAQVIALQQDAEAGIIDAALLGESWNERSAKSLVQQKKLKEVLAKRKKLAAQEAKLLWFAIRLVEQQHRSAHIGVAIASVREFCSLLAAGAELPLPGFTCSLACLHGGVRKLLPPDEETQARPLFSLTVGFNPSNEAREADQDSLTFYPSRSEFEGAAGKFWEGISEGLSRVPSILCTRHYDTLPRPEGRPELSRMEGRPVSRMITGMPEFVIFADYVSRKLLGDVDGAIEYSMAHYAPARVVFDFGLQWDENQYIEQVGQDCDRISEDMDLMKDFKEAVIPNVKLHHTVGAILVDGQPMRSSLEPVPVRALEVMKRLLNDIAEEKSKEVVGKLEQIHRTLDNKPTSGEHDGDGPPASLPAYTGYISAVRQIQDELQGLEEGNEMVTGLYATLRKFGATISLDEQMQLDVMQSKMEELTDKKLLEASVCIENIRMDMTRDCLEKCTSLDDELAHLERSLGGGVFLSADPVVNGTHEDVIEELDRIQDKIAKDEERVNTLLQSLQLMRANPYDFSQLQKLKSRYEQRRGIWDTVATWRSLTTNWLNVPLREVDVEEMNRTVNTMFKEAFKLSKQLDGDQVVDQTKSLIEHWKGNLT
ncbi:hypothetical protein FOZ63_030166, partial [Perkinsus olseni]